MGRFQYFELRTNGTPQGVVLLHRRFFPMASFLFHHPKTSKLDFLGLVKKIFNHQSSIHLLFLTIFWILHIVSVWLFQNAHEFHDNGMHLPSAKEVWFQGKMLHPTEPNKPNCHCRCSLSQLAHTNVPSGPCLHKIWRCNQRGHMIDSFFFCLPSIPNEELCCSKKMYYHQTAYMAWKCPNFLKPKGQNQISWHFLSFWG